MWIDEARMCLKLNEDCFLKYKLSSCVVIDLCLNLNELIYSWSWKLAVIDCLHTVGSPLTRCRITVWLVNMTVGLIFQIVGSPFRSRGYPSVLVDVGESFTQLVGSPFRSKDQSLFLLDIGEPFITHIGSSFRSRDQSLFLLDIGEPFISHIGSPFRSRG